jgi:hypothetical protein
MGHHRRQWMNLFKSFESGIGKICGRPPAPPAAWIHQIHAAGGVGGSITLVMVFVRSLCFLCCFWLVTRQSDSAYLCFRGDTKCPTQACTTPFIYCTRVYIVCRCGWIGSLSGAYPVNTYVSPDSHSALFVSSLSLLCVSLSLDYCMQNLDISWVSPCTWIFDVPLILPCG